MNSKEFKKLYVKNGKILPNDVEEIEGNLDLLYENIKVIENLPDFITGSLFLNHNKIKKIENLPDISGSLDLSHNQIKKIENLQKIISGDLRLNNNLISKIENLPMLVEEDIWLSDNNITKIENLPKVKGNIHILGNKITEYDKSNKGFDTIYFNQFKGGLENKEYFDYVKTKGESLKSIKRFQGLTFPISLKYNDVSEGKKYPKVFKDIL